MKKKYIQPTIFEVVLNVSSLMQDTSYGGGDKGNYNPEGGDTQLGRSGFWDDED